MTVGIYVNFSKDIKAKNAIAFIDLLNKNDIDYFVCDEVSEYIDKNILPINELLDKCDILIVFGGDGTMLKVVNLASEKNIPVLGINMGKVGFLTEATVNDFEEIIKIIKSGYSISKRTLLETQLNGLTYRAVNEITVGSKDFNVLELEVIIDGFLSDKITADGVIIATPTGSTAYSLSAGGPLVSPENHALIITPICAHNLRSRPIVIKDNHFITIKICGKNKNASLVVDGKIVEENTKFNSVNIKKADIQASLVEFGKENFYQKLLKKL